MGVRVFSSPILNPNCQQSIQKSHAFHDVVNKLSAASRGPPESDSLLIFPDICAAWDGGEVVSNTLITLTNDAPSKVRVQFYVVLGTNEDLNRTLRRALFMCWPNPFGIGAATTEVGCPSQMYFPKAAAKSSWPTSCPTPHPVDRKSSSRKECLQQKCGAHAKPPGTQGNMRSDDPSTER